MQGMPSSRPCGADNAEVSHAQKADPGLCDHLERLRAFFRFAVENGWIEETPAKHLRPPIVKDRPTLPFGREEMARILEHAGDSRLSILTMRYTGMRISDTVMLQASALNANQVFLYTHCAANPPG
jgi:site-specific recombinase XerD